MYFYNYKNNKRTNSIFNKVFAMRRHFNVKFGTVFFLTSLAIFGKIERFFSRLSRFPTKKFEILEAHPGFGKGGGTTEVWGQRGVGFHVKKTLILAHFFNEIGHAVSAVTRDNTKIFLQLTVCLKAEAWPK